MKSKVEEYIANWQKRIDHFNTVRDGTLAAAQAGRVSWENGFDSLYSDIDITLASICQEMLNYIRVKEKEYEAELKEFRTISQHRQPGDLVWVFSDGKLYERKIVQVILKESAFAVVFAEYLLSGSNPKWIGDEYLFDTEEEARKSIPAVPMK